MYHLRPAAVAALLATPFLAFAQDTPPTEPFNPDPGPCCGCIAIRIAGQTRRNIPAVDPVAVFDETNGDYTLKLSVVVGSVGETGGITPTPPPPAEPADTDPCAGVRITSIYIVADGPYGRLYSQKVYENASGTRQFPLAGDNQGVLVVEGTDPDHKPDGTIIPDNEKIFDNEKIVTIPGEMASLEKNLEETKWKVVVGCSGPVDSQSSTTVFDCSFPFTLGGCPCQTCKSASCVPTARIVSDGGDGSKGGLLCDIPLGSADAGDTNGSLKFLTSGMFATGYAFPGLSGMSISAPSSVTFVRGVNGNNAPLITVTTSTTTVEITPTPADSTNSITISHKHGADVFRTTTIKYVAGAGGAPAYLRVFSDYSGTKFGYQQSKTADRTYLLESGPTDDSGVVTPWRKESLAIAIVGGNQELHETVVEADPKATSTFLPVSDVTTTWENFPWAWEKTKEVIDPNGTPLTSTWSYYSPGENTGNPATPDVTTTEGYGQLKEYVRYDGYVETHNYWPNNHSTILPFADNPQGLTVSRTWTAGTGNALGTLTTTRSACGNTLSKEDVEFVGGTATPTITTTTYATGGTTPISLATITTLMPYHSDFGGQPKSIRHSDGTLTTFDPVYQKSTNTIAGKTITTITGKTNTTI